MNGENFQPNSRDLGAAPIVVTDSGVVLNGHTRLVASQHFEMGEVPAIVVKHPDLRRLQSEG